MSFVYLLEPSPALKIQRFGLTISDPKRAANLKVDDAEYRILVERQINEIRKDSLNDLDSLAQQFQESLAQKDGVRLILAETADQAVQHIQRISGSTRTIAVNKAATVRNELIPSLRRAGFDVCESYFHQYESFQNRFEGPWQFPSFGLGVLGSSISMPVDLTRLRRHRLAREGARDMVAVMGVSAAASEDGSMYFFQHGHNISGIFQQARKVILVVGLDKLTNRAEESIFQTSCMALYGVESVLLGLQPKDEIGPSVDDLPMLPREAASKEIFVLLLDNGRRRILNTQYRALLTCISCRACSGCCPTYTYFGGPQNLSPKEYVYFYALGQNDSLELCIQCGQCKSHCPVAIDIPGLIAFSRSKMPRPLVEKILANYETVSKPGRSIPSLVNALVNNRIFRGLAENTLGISKDRSLPSFPKESFADWFHEYKG
jgi:L-lactate utilization protein LutB